MEGRGRSHIGETSLVILGVMLGVAYWLCAALAGVYLFHDGRFTQQLLPGDLRDLWSRAVVFVFFMVFGILAQYIVQQRRRAEAREEQSRRDLSMLSSAAMGFIELPADEDIYEYIGRQLKNLLGDAIVLVTSFDESNDSLSVRAVVGLSRPLQTVVRLLGRNPVGMTVDMDEETRSGIQSGEMVQATDGLYEVSRGRVPKAVCEQVERMLGIGEIHAMGFSRKGGVFGDAIIFMRHGATLDNRSVVETFVHQASIALQKRRAEEELQAMSLIDPLTTLYNRRGFLTLGEQQIKLANRGRRGMMLLFADLDGLKKINDTLGHHEGDRALTETASVLRETFRDSDIIARLGGDEFVVLLLETHVEGAEIIPSRLQSVIDEHNATGRLPFTLAMSTGLAYYDPYHPCSVQDLMDRADALMYEEKRARKRGRGDTAPANPTPAQ
jgi:diguanylate cyclase (GGDEF)-like protein